MSLGWGLIDYATRFKQAIEPYYDVDGDLLTKTANDLAKVDPEPLRIGAMRDAADHQIEQELTAAQKEHLKQVVVEAPAKSERKSREVGLQKILNATPAVRALLMVGPFGGAIVHWVISPDAMTLATADQNTIKLWDLGTGRERTNLGFALYPASWTNSKMAFGPSGKMLAGSSAVLGSGRQPGAGCPSRGCRGISHGCSGIHFVAGLLDRRQNACHGVSHGRDLMGRSQGLETRWKCGQVETACSVSRHPSSLSTRTRQAVVFPVKHKSSPACSKSRNGAKLPIATPTLG